MPATVFDPPERFVAGTVGPPGGRTFFLQASGEGRLVSVSLEKVQVSVLADRVNELLDAHAEGTATEPLGGGDSDPLATPIEDEFRVDTLALAWTRRATSWSSSATTATPRRPKGPRRRPCRPCASCSARWAGPAFALAPRRGRVRRPSLLLRSAASRWTRPATSAPAPTGTDAEHRRRPRRPPDERGADLVGRIVDSSNGALLCSVEAGGRDADAEPVLVIHKPEASERPLWDYPDGTLVAASGPRTS